MYHYRYQEINMKVLKFGGTSVGNVARMRQVLDIILLETDNPIVVLSAMSGTTDRLHSIVQQAQEQTLEKAFYALRQLRSEYEQIALQLFTGQPVLVDTNDYLNVCFTRIDELLRRESIGEAELLEIVAQGEVLSTYLFYQLCRSEGLDAVLLSALDFVRLDVKAEPDLEETAERLLPLLHQYRGARMIITQGYICRNHLGGIDNLRRGGSDYSATIIGGLVVAEEIQIWTDIDGVRNNDPRLVENTYPIRAMSYREAAELSYFGAKILHPTCVLPAERAGVPLRLKYTMSPEAPGTLISQKGSGRAITAVAAKDGITAIKIYSHRMLMAYGFLRRVFQVFEDYETPVDMITTSEVAVSLTIDNDRHLQAIERYLSQFGEVTVETGYSIVCVVGNELYENGVHLDTLFHALIDVPVRMVSMGGSKYNISLLVETRYKLQVLKALNTLFDEVVVEQ